MDNIFSWQKKDYKRLCEAFMPGSKILFIHGRDFESPYHVLTSFHTQLSEQEHVLFEINMVSPYLSHPFLPFAQAANRVLRQKQASKPLLPCIVKDITQSDTAAAIVENIVNERHFSTSLNQYETELLVQLENATNGGTPVFSFRGYPLFDANSQNLAVLLVSGLLNDDFPFLKNAKFLFVCEAEDSSVSFQRIKQMEHTDIFLSDPQQEDMEEILAEISPELCLLPEEREKLFYLSGGRLSVIDILSRYLASKGQTSIDGSAQEVVDATLADRISHMGELGATLESVLEFAANIGNTFYIPLLKQVVDASTCDLALRKSDQEFFTKCGQDSGKFVCREIWDFFYACPDENRKREIAYALERAIYYFDPYDYLTRAHYLEQAENIRDACELYFFAYNSIVQEGLAPEADLENRIIALSMQCGLNNYWNSLFQAYGAMDSLDYKSCVEILDNMGGSLTTRLLLLKEYLTGLCLHRLGNTLDHQREAMLSIQAATEYARNIEDGIWCDCQMILLSLLVNSNGDIYAAKRICKELTYYYTQKNYAPFAQKGLYALKRKWSALYSVERATQKTEDSVLYFRNGLYPSQYLMALNNHAANLIVLGNYTEAIKYLNEAIGALQKFQAVRVNRMYLLSNYCLCAVLSETLSPADVYKKLLPIMAQREFGDWTIIFQMNCAIYMALAGEIDRAEENLRTLEKVSLELCDDYYLFYVYANLAAVLYLQGRRTEAVSLLRENCSKPPLLFKATEKTYLEERSKKWISAMESVDIKDPKAFDTYLLDRHPPTTQWAFIGRGFLYSDIQFWSEP
ncbi:hypothetical protein [uncultured Oscillibacter sp.]|uniref:hypothetical protein n=1 Tax=uncultured Oscillibacter sp. TaxID=876091 RepID=UPI0025CDD5AA|nr:hypothetical protein [uncultured Oscillibacter sp.]